MFHTRMRALLKKTKKLRLNLASLGRILQLAHPTAAHVNLVKKDEAVEGRKTEKKEDGARVIRSCPSHHRMPNVRSTHRYRGLITIPLTLQEQAPEKNVQSAERITHKIK